MSRRIPVSTTILTVSTTLTAATLATGRRRFIMDTAREDLVLTLPAPATMGELLVIKASASNTLTIQASGSGTINGASSVALSALGEAVRLIGTAAGWLIPNRLTTIP